MLLEGIFNSRIGRERGGFGRERMGRKEKKK